MCFCQTSSLVLADLEDSSFNCWDLPSSDDGRIHTHAQFWRGQSGQWSLASQVKHHIRNGFCSRFSVVPISTLDWLVAGTDYWRWYWLGTQLSGERIFGLIIRLNMAQTFSSDWGSFLWTCAAFEELSEERLFTLHSALLNVSLGTKLHLLWDSCIYKAKERPLGFVVAGKLKVKFRGLSQRS